MPSTQVNSVTDLTEIVNLSRAYGIRLPHPCRSPCSYFLFFAADMLGPSNDLLPDPPQDLILVACRANGVSSILIRGRHLLSRVIILSALATQNQHSNVFLRHDP